VPSRRALFHSAISALVLLSAFHRAWTARWVCDDAFISFRYAAHLAHGQGLVWNPGERVEGITNLLWTLLLAPAEALRWDPVVVSQALGLASLAALAFVEWRFARESESDAPAVPLALWVTFSIQDMLVWATGGLETMTFTACVAAMALLSFGRSEPGPRRELAAGLLGATLVLLRPDGALLAAILGGARVLFAARRAGSGLVASGTIRVAARALGPLVLASAVVTAWRLAYYGDPLPNTYYAKSAGASYFGKGAAYIVLLFARDWVLFVAAVLGACLFVRRAVRGGGRAGIDEAATALVAATVVFSLYVVRSGGDFMFARRLVPVVPLGLMALERVLWSLEKPLFRDLAAGVLAVSAWFPYPLYERFGEKGRIDRISDEPSFYPPELLRVRRAQAAALAAAFEGIDATLVFRGGLCVLGYYSDLPKLIEPNGLTDRVVAKAPLTARGVPGHEKIVPEWYVEKRRAQFVIDREPYLGPPDLHTMTLAGGLVKLDVLFYDEAVMASLERRPGVRLLSTEAMLADAENDVSRSSCADARDVLDYLDGFYFSKNPGTDARRGHLAARVAARCEP